MTPAAQSLSSDVSAPPPVAAAPSSAVTPPVSGRRTEKELLLATRAYTDENVAKGWWYTLSTLGVLVGLGAGAVLSPWWPLRLAFALVEGLTIVRMFCLFHDFQHGAILRQSKPAQLLFFLFGEAILTPPSVWRETHNYHHAHTAKFVGSHIGSYPVVTTAMWGQMSGAQKFMYKLVRHPLNMLLAVFTVFTLGMCISPFLRNPTKHWAGPLSLVLCYGVGGLLISTGHGDAWVFGWLIPMAVGCAAGAYLFYAQHNFPNALMPSREEWSFSGAALDSSSYFVMSPVMHWFTANIGFHHVHHLNAAIPFYRLEETMKGVPELQHPGQTSWAWKDVSANFRLKVYDAQANVMVGYPS